LEVFLSEGGCFVNEREGKYTAFHPMTIPLHSIAYPILQVNVSDPETYTVEWIYKI
jgi:hypothetical protein